MNWVELQERFRARILEAAELSRDGAARMIHASGRAGSLVTNGYEYWFEGMGPGGLQRIPWDFVRKAGHRKCAKNSWVPNQPMGPLERLAQAAE